MRRILLFAGALAALAILGVAAPGGAGAATFPQCPPVDKDTGCQFLVTVSNGGQSISEDSSQGPYESSDDALVGIVNNSSSPISSIHMSAEDELFGFEDDGICNPGEAPIAPGCKVAAENTNHEKTEKAGKECVYEGEERGGKKVTEAILEACAFPVPAGEPSGVTFPEFAAVGFENGDAVTGYEGPRTYYTNIGPLGFSATGSGTVNFSPALAPGESTYFSLESPPAGGFGSASTLTTTLSGGGQSAPSITVLQGTPVTDTAVLGGANASTATGTLTYNIYSDAACTKLVAGAGSVTVNGATAPASTAANLAPGTYYWQASYGGDINNKAISSACGGEVLTVQAPTTTTTSQTGGGVTGPSIPVLLGSAVTDKATISGSLAAQAGGAVTYTLYSDSKCTKPVASSVGSVVSGVGSASAPVKPSKVGTYYWTAVYSGGGLNAGSASACGSEQLVVSKHAVLFEKGAGKKCFSKRAFAIHPKFPKGAKITSYKEYINGSLAKQGHLSNHATSVNLIGLPKGAYKVELVTFTSSGASFEDTRTFHTCVPKKHKKHHH